VVVEFWRFFAVGRAWVEKWIVKNEKYLKKIKSIFFHFEFSMCGVVLFKFFRKEWREMKRNVALGLAKEWCGME